MVLCLARVLFVVCLLSITVTAQAPALSGRASEGRNVPARWGHSRGSAATSSAFGLFGNAPVTGAVTNYLRLRVWFRRIRLNFV